MSNLLPAEYADLEKFADWILPTEGERYSKRLASSMEELQTFYDAAFPRLQEAVPYLQSIRLDEINDKQRNLLYLFFSLVNASFPVEVWRQARVPDSGASTVDCLIEPAV